MTSCYQVDQEDQNHPSPALRQDPAAQVDQADQEDQAAREVLVDQVCLPSELQCNPLGQAE
jgi:hypothetical protein